MSPVQNGGSLLQTYLDSNFESKQSELQSSPNGDVRRKSFFETCQIEATPSISNAEESLQSGSFGQPFMLTSFHLSFRFRSIKLLHDA